MTLPQDQVPRASIIVPVRNGRRDLENLLAALENQTIPQAEFEVVIADDGSTDGTAEWLQTRESDWIRVTLGGPRNSYAARNRAVRLSRSRVLAFCDADCVPVPDWLERGVAALERTDIAAGRVRFILPANRTVWTLLDMDTSKDQERDVRNETAETANLFLHRTLFDRVGGFEETIPEFGDFDFVQRAVRSGARLSFAGDSVVWHPTRDRGRQLLRALWIYNRGYAAREAREDRTPEGLRWQALVPVVSVARSRKWWGRSYGPDTRWLGENDVVPTRIETTQALFLMYLVVPYVRAAAQLRGWFEGRRLRTGSATVDRNTSETP